MRVHAKLDLNNSHMTHVALLAAIVLLYSTRLKILNNKEDRNKQHPKKVQVGVGIVLTKQNDGTRAILVGKRISKHGMGQYALPGGWLEIGESIEQCALRELCEETGISVVRNVHVMAVPPCLNVFSPTSASVSIYVMAETDDNSEHPTLMEPEKCEGWIWAKPRTEQWKLIVEKQGLFPSLAHVLQFLTI